MGQGHLWAWTGLICALSASSVFATCTGNGPLTLVSSTDDGLYEETHGPQNAIDGNFDPDSRWSNLGQGEPKHLLIDLGAVQTVKSIGIAWYKGNERKATFALETSVDGTQFAPAHPRGLSGGATLAFEDHPLPPTQARYVRVAAEGNEANEWNSIVEISVSGCGTEVARPTTPVLTPRQSTGDRKSVV